MFERHEIQRTPVEGKFKYHWDMAAQSEAAEPQAPPSSMAAAEAISARSVGL